jgi:hypothetical protein
MARTLDEVARYGLERGVLEEGAEPHAGKSRAPDPTAIAKAFSRQRQRSRPIRICLISDQSKIIAQNSP